MSKIIIDMPNTALKDALEKELAQENEKELNLLKEKYQEMSSNPEFVGLLQDWNYNYEGKEN
jgi:hypothetical protein